MEFEDKVVAKEVAKMLNGQRMGMSHLIPCLRNPCNQAIISYISTLAASQAVSGWAACLFAKSSDMSNLIPAKSQLLRVNGIPVAVQAHNGLILGTFRVLSLCAWLMLHFRSKEAVSIS